MQKIVSQLGRFFTKLVIVILAAALTVDVALSQGPARGEDIGLMLAYHLNKISEPELWKNYSEGGTSYRLLDINFDNHIWAFRVTRMNSKTQAITSSFSPREGVETSSRVVAESDWNTLKSLFTLNDFWNLPMETDIWKLEEHRKNVYFEGCENGRYHVIRRSSDFSDVTELLRFMVELIQRSDSGALVD